MAAGFLRNVPEEKRARYKRIKIFTIAVTVLVIVLAFVYYNFYNVSDELKVGLEGADLYFGESTVRARRDVGKPAEEYEEDGYKVWNYQTILLYGTLTETELKFKDGRLREVDSTLSKTDREDLFETVIASVTEAYKNRDGFFVTDKATYEASGYCTISGKAEGAVLHCDVFDKETCVMIVTWVGN